MVLDQNLEPNDISKELDLLPDQEWRYGEVREFSDSKHTFEWGGWKKNLPKELRYKSIEKQVEYWAELLKDKTDVISQMKKKLEVVALDCFITTDETASIILSHTLQKSVCELGLEIRVSIST